MSNHENPQGQSNDVEEAPSAEVNELSPDEKLSESINNLVEQAEKNKDAVAQTYRRLLAEEQKAKAETEAAKKVVEAEEEEGEESAEGHTQSEVNSTEDGNQETETDKKAELAEEAKDKEPEKPVSFGGRITGWFRKIAEKFKTPEDQKKNLEAENSVARELQSISVDREQLANLETSLVNLAESIAFTEKMKDSDSKTALLEKLNKEKEDLEKQKTDLEAAIAKKSYKYIEAFKKFREKLLGLEVGCYKTELEINQMESDAIALLIDLQDGINKLSSSLKDSENDSGIKDFKEEVEKVKQKLAKLAEERARLSYVKTLVSQELKRLDNTIIGFSADGYSKHKHNEEAQKVIADLKSKKIEAYKSEIDSDKLPDFDAEEKAERARRQELGGVQNGYGSVAAWVELMLDELGIMNPTQREEEKDKIYSGDSMIAGFTKKARMINAPEVMVSGHQLTDDRGDRGGLARIKNTLKKIYRKSDEEINEIIEKIKVTSEMNKVKEAQEVKKETGVVEESEDAGESEEVNEESIKEKKYSPNDWKKMITKSVKEIQQTNSLVTLRAIMDHSFGSDKQTKGVDDVQDKIGEILEEYFLSQKLAREDQIKLAGTCIKLIRAMIKKDVAAQSSASEVSDSKSIEEDLKISVELLSEEILNNAIFTKFSKEDKNQLKRWLEKELADKFKEAKTDISALGIAQEVLASYLRQTYFPPQKKADIGLAARAAELIIAEAKRKFNI